MRKRFLLPCFAFSILILLSYSYVFAEQDILLPVKTDKISLDELLPDDPQLKRGKFKNGLEYFIYKNSTPENKIELRLVIKVGSVMEDDDQLGAAHFIEHMAFNGTKHFPKNKIVEFSESIGMKFGHDLSASTSFEDTIYKLSVPANTPKILEKAFQIMEDWAHGITFDPKEIEQERSVIIEEWRTREDAPNRAKETHIQSLLKGSRYTERWPIGTLDSIRSLNKDKLLRFYRDWYRPDLMAVIAVGDFDIKLIENQIRKHFNHISLPVNPREAIANKIPEHDKRRISISIDPGIFFQTVEIYKKVNSNNDATIKTFRKEIVEYLYNYLFYIRLGEITREVTPPFSHAEPNKQQLTRSTIAYKLFAMFSSGSWDNALKVLLQESERIARYGFTETELKRMKKQYLSELERGLLNRNNKKSYSIASDYTNAFLYNKTIPEFEYETMLKKRILPDISLEEVNELGRMLKYDKNCVVVVSINVNEGITIPDEKKIEAVFDEVADMKIEPYVDTFRDVPLLKKIPIGSKIISSISKEEGITEWKLANGVRVVLKPTDFDATLIVFRGFSPGGTSLASDVDFISAKEAEVLIGSSGVGDFNANDLEKKLADTYVYVDPYISEYEQGVSGHGTKSDLETLFQMIYLTFTSPRADLDYFKQYRERRKIGILNQENFPIAKFNKTLNQIVTRDHPRRRFMTIDSLEKMDLQQSLDFYKERFADASDFTFIFVGAFELDKMRVMVERYLGGLPSINRQENFKDHGLRYADGVIKKTVTAGVDPRSRTQIIFSGYFDKDEQPDEPLLEVLTKLFENRLLEILREELGGIYSVSVDFNIIRQPLRAYFIEISFVSDPDREKELAARVFKEIEHVKNIEFSEDKASGVRKAMLIDYHKDVKNNRYWLAKLLDSYRYDAEPGVASILEYPDLIKGLTPERIKEGMRRFFNTNNYIHVTLMPEK